MTNLILNLSAKAKEQSFLKIKEDFEFLPKAALDEMHSQLFAELIIKKIVDIMEVYSKANMESDSWVEMIEMMKKEVKTTFGVQS